MRAVAFDVTPELLAELFHLPPSAVLYGATARIDMTGRTMFTFVAEDRTLPEADRPWTGSPTWTKHRIEFNGWGIDRPVAS